MKVTLATVGRPSRLLAGAIAEFEARAARYWKLEIAEVREERAAGNRSPEEVMAAEAERLLGRAPQDARRVAMTRTGEAWSSERLAEFLNEMAIRGEAGAAFFIGGAFGLDAALRDSAHHALSLSAMTLPHDLARLALAEQLYRAGTIVRGEPYHKG